MDKIVIKAKKVECIIGLFFLLPPVLGVFAFVLQLFNADTDFLCYETYRQIGLMIIVQKGVEVCPQLLFI